MQDSEGKVPGFLLLLLLVGVDWSVFCDIVDRIDVCFGDSRSRIEDSLFGDETAVLFRNLKQKPFLSKENAAFRIFYSNRPKRVEKDQNSRG